MKEKLKQRRWGGRGVGETEKRKGKEPDWLCCFWEIRKVERRNEM